MFLQSILTCMCRYCLLQEDPWTQTFILSLYFSFHKLFQDIHSLCHQNYLDLNLKTKAAVTLFLILPHLLIYLKMFSHGSEDLRLMLWNIKSCEAYFFAPDAPQLCKLHVCCDKRCKMALSAFASGQSKSGFSLYSHIPVLVSQLEIKQRFPLKLLFWMGRVRYCRVPSNSVSCCS